MWALKRHMTKMWPQMTAAKMDIMLKTIHELSCMTLQQSLETNTVKAVDPDEDVPSGCEVLSRLPECQTQGVVTEHCITLFDNLSVAMGYMSASMANLSSLAKLTDPKMFRIILEASTWPLVQLNILDGMLNPIVDKAPPSEGKAHRERLRGALLPNEKCTVLRREPKNSTTRLLTAVIYLKLKW